MEPDRSQSGAETGLASARDWRIAEMFDNGHDFPDIVRQVFDVTSASGSRYQRASRDVQTALRRVRQRR